MDAPLQKPQQSVSVEDVQTVVNIYDRLPENEQKSLKNFISGLYNPRKSPNRSTADLFTHQLHVSVKNFIEQQDLEEYARKAQVLYDLNVKRKTADQQDPLLPEKAELAGRLRNAQTELILNGNNPINAGRIFDISNAYLVRIYGAQSSQELESVELGIKRIESSIERDQNEQKLKEKKRRRTHWAAIIITFLALIALCLFVVIAPRFNIEANTLIPVLKIPVGVVVWSGIGSFASILYRFNRSEEAEIDGLTRWLLTRPITGVLMATISYFILSTGIIVLTSTNVLVDGNEIIWLIAFIIGFSDRFAERTLRLLVGKFGGEENEEIVAKAEYIPSEQELYLTAVLDLLDGPRVTTSQENDSQDKEDGKTEQSTDMTS